MARRVSRIYGGSPIVNAFIYDIDADNSDINIKSFPAPTEEWARFVINTETA